MLKVIYLTSLYPCGGVSTSCPHVKGPPEKPILSLPKPILGGSKKPAPGRRLDAKPAAGPQKTFPFPVKLQGGSIGSYNYGSSLYYSVSDLSRSVLVAEGTACSFFGGKIEEVCELSLSPGQYVVRVGGNSVEYASAPAPLWTFCGVSGYAQEEIVVSVTPVGDCVVQAASAVRGPAEAQTVITQGGDADAQALSWTTTLTQTSSTAGFEIGLLSVGVLLILAAVAVRYVRTHGSSMTVAVSSALRRQPAYVAVNKVEKEETGGKDEMVETGSPLSSPEAVRTVSRVTDLARPSVYRVLPSVDEADVKELGVRSAAVNNLPIVPPSVPVVPPPSLPMVSPVRKPPSAPVPGPGQAKGPVSSDRSLPWKDKRRVTRDRGGRGEKKTDAIATLSGL